MAIKVLFDKINEINTKADYWFVRTDSGDHFDTYVNNGFIGIGWNKITIEDLTKRTEVEVKEKISKVYPPDDNVHPDEPRAKAHVTSIYNKLLHFLNLKKGDRIISPSRGSDVYAFGIIEDSKIFNDLDQSYNCEYFKRRKVRWVIQKEFDDLDVMFYKIRMSRHAVSSINEYSSFIDKEMDTVFFKGNFGHLILDVEKKHNINLNSLIQLVENVQDLCFAINTQFGLGEDVQKSFVRLNLQSPGTIELMLEKGKTLIILSAVISIMSCGNTEHLQIPQEEKKQLEKFVSVNKEKLKSIDEAMKELEVNREKINKAH